MTRSSLAQHNSASATVPDTPMAVVVAHPDDEALWLSSVIASADRVVFCYGARADRPQMSRARRQAVAELPLRGIVDLGLAESGCYRADQPVELRPTPAGVEIPDVAARGRYEANYMALLAALRPQLTGFHNVCTHNPWGEYGHPEHVQVHRAVAALQAELGYTMWFSNYVAAASWPLACALADRQVWTERRVLAPDRAMARRLARLYRRHGAWTWSRVHRWPREETLYAQPPADDPAPRYALSGEWLLDVAGLRWWPTPWRRPQRRLP